MKKITFLLGTLLLSSVYTYAQQKKQSLCARNFEEVYQKTEDNYAGWNEKITDRKKKKFDALTARTIKKAAKIDKAEACYYVVNDWLAFFEDGHLFINIQSPFVKTESPKEIIKRASKVNKMSFKGEAAFKKYLDKNPAQSNVVGVWETEDKNYRVGVVADRKKGKYKGFLLSKRDELWSEGKVKFTLKEISENKFDSKYYYADFTSTKKLGRLVKNYLVIDDIYKFKKVYPAPLEEINNEDILTRLPEWRVEKIDANTVLITLPPFTIIDAADYIQEMINKNKRLLVNTENLIVDLRNNPGGDENAFSALYPYIADKPIIRKGGVFRASEENLILLTHELESIQNFPKYKRILAPKLQEVITEMKNNMGSDIQGPDKVFQYVRAMPYPKKVAILVNENTASTAESVTLEAKQSDKTVVIGTKTKGLADYIEVRDWGLPAFGWRLAFGLAKSARDSRIDNKGIKPDVKVPKREADWVKYASEYLSKNR
ncbi:MAG: hypothetical protein ACI9DJ_000113 [Algoriphagus sp.]|jgi:hypothetical protein